MVVDLALGVILEFRGRDGVLVLGHFDVLEYFPDEFHFSPHVCLRNVGCLELGDPIMWGGLCGWCLLGREVGLSD